MSVLLQLARYLPSIRKPDRSLSFREKIMWTLVTLLLYFLMSEVYIFGASPQQITQFQTFQTILGSSIGTLITLGIGPIVSASIILQLLTGADIIPWDLNSQKGKAKFQDTQKLLSYAFALFQSIAFVAMGAISPAIGGFLGFALVTAQLTIGGWFVILMDEVISKWGFHSGVSLFILAGVSKAMVIQLISPFTSGGEIAFAVGQDPAGALLQFMQGTFAASTVSGLFFTILVFLVAVYAQSMRVEIPLTFGNVRGFGRKWPLKFVYTNVIPVIFVSALLSNFKLWASFASRRGVELTLNLPHMGDPFYILGNYSPSAAPSADTLIYYFSAPTNFPSQIWETLTTFTMQVPPEVLFQVFTYTSFYVVSSAIFSVFWMRTSSQDPSSVADQIMDIGMKVPGFRKDKRVIVKILNRYIPGLAVLGGAFVGFLAALANFTNSFGTGTGILLAVMIAFQFYEEIVKKHMEEMHPSIRNFMSNIE